MEFIGAFSSHIGYIALFFYLIVSKFFEMRKEKKEKFATHEALKELESKLEKHIKESTEWRKKQDSQAQGQVLLNALMVTPPNCSVSRFEQLKHEFEKYANGGNNGYVADYWYNWLERREKSQKNLKQNKK